MQFRSILFLSDYKTEDNTNLRIIKKRSRALIFDELRPFETRFLDYTMLFPPRTCHHGSFNIFEEIVT
jgi:hypothetical protein